jgi:C-methyltransferase C-terminal domain/Putative zinc binding domain
VQGVGLICRGCSSERTSEVVDLGVVPASDWFPPIDDPHEDPRWPLRVFFCQDCLLVQLGPDVHPTPEPPRALESKTSQLHAKQSAIDVVQTENLAPGDTIIELDSHHGGSWLGGFVEAGLAPRPPDQTADLVVDVHSLAHEADLRAPLAAHAARLAAGGRLVLEFHHLLPLVEESQIDTIRHGHWVYLSLLSMQRLLDQHGLVVTRAVQVPVFGGSLRITAGRVQDDCTIDASVGRVLAAERAVGLQDGRSMAEFGRRGSSLAARVRADLVRAQEDKLTVAGYGAPSKAPVLAALAGIDESLLPYTVDLSPEKHGRRLPGTRIEILSPEELLRRQPEVVVVFTWDIIEEVTTQLRDAAAGSGWAPRFYVPLPVPGYVGADAVR